MSARLAITCGNCGGDVLMQQACVGGVVYPPFGYCVPCGYATVVHCFRVSEIVVSLSSPGRDDTTGAAPGEVAASPSFVFEASI